jgi:sialate O-acetylesterase
MQPQNEPSALFNGMLAPLVGYGIRGAIWYQGEGNAWQHADYRELTGLMIGDWRHRWGQGDFPFFFVQLAGWQPGGDAWPFLREAQLKSLEIPQTGMAVAMDVGDAMDIHPRNKLAVGQRLALAARAVAHGEKIDFSGPIYRDMKIEDGQAILSFDHVGAGLVAQGGTLSGFEICEADREFVPADAVIAGESIIVSDHKIREPTAVRYSWRSFPAGNLYNAAGLPASPFRTDEFAP